MTIVNPNWKWPFKALPLLAIAILAIVGHKHIDSQILRTVLLLAAIAGFLAVFILFSRAGSPRSYKNPRHNSTDENAPSEK